MTRSAKFVTAAAVILLLGLGMCGVDQLIPSSRTQEFGGGLSFFGIVLFFIAVLMIGGYVVWLVLTALIDVFRRR